MTNHFPQNLSILRRQAGYTQETLAEALGGSRQAVGKWEAGQALPEAATLLTLADLLGCSLDALMRESLTETGELLPLTPENDFSGPIMILATAGFLIWGLMWDGWHVSWVCFLIGAALVALCQTLQNGRDGR